MELLGAYRIPPRPWGVQRFCQGRRARVFATINRNLKAYLLAVVGAILLRLLPRGTHDYARFIKPSELAAMCRPAGLSVADLTGMTYNPLTRVYALGPDTDVNYILHATKT
jgi:2-polyprenyl-6-hydroxyphenyl methylase/3-demethylubiquinone-9 3-methyltransferase